MSDPIVDAPNPAPETKPKSNRIYSSALMIRIRPDQSQRLHELAAEAGMNVSTYIRVKLKLEKAKGVRPPPL
jgi:predicted HicB family RNase H-like nuclease